MGNWEEYKSTFNLSEDIFALARSGDVHQLRNFLDSTSATDINQKNPKGYSPLMISVYNGNQDASGLLLERGADPNSSDLAGNTILMGAAFKGDVEMATLLIQRGARKDQKNYNGQTAEEWASAFGRRNVLSILKPEAPYSRIENMINAVKVIWGFIKTHNRKEVTA